jgi:hypothetical protein
LKDFSLSVEPAFFMPDTHTIRLRERPDSDAAPQ